MNAMNRRAPAVVAAPVVVPAALSAPIAVALLDNDALALEALRVVVARQHMPCTVAWHTTSVAVALHRCASGGNVPDALLLDMALDGISGTEVAARIRRRNACTAIIGVTAYSLDAYRDDAVIAGMQALIAKDKLVRELPSVMASIVSGGVWPESSEKGGFDTVAESHRRLHETTIAGLAAEQLSARERDILQRYAAGASTDDIAAALAISRNSVFTYVRRACTKLGVRTRAEALEQLRLHRMFR
ncbi:response regulator transcription factor [Bifidobacterium oedipodis]|uniref:Two component transcriptional regulator, LuxR family n=1 Tax=Bifidobacterium oedipodis TaxID=2675322 RepID=A0A7Y0ERR6_9BIFI|nr:response regulator transcription factor [Bifidobacterium sp. DSM 109957]NMM95197.1 two component transcriptional regulator, LuxR family [Bifidobacterium sp. DSM 109957]